jgi:hypothetical protein
MVPSALKGATSGTEGGFPAGDYLLSVALAVPEQGPAIIVDNGFGVRHFEKIILRHQSTNNKK